MDGTTLNTIVGIVGTVVGIIGIVVGIIGAKNLYVANQMNNNAKAGKGSTINQGNTYNYGNGISEETARLITKDMTKEEMCRLIVRLIPIDTDDDNCIANQLAYGNVKADDFETVLAELPTIYYGKKEPTTHRKGNMWFRKM